MTRREVRILNATLSMEPSQEPATEPSETRSIELAYDKPTDDASESPAVAASALRALHPPDPVLFHLGAGYGALGRVDLALCRDQGLQVGYLHLYVTFRVDGRIVRAVVESPVAPPPDALACIGEQLKVSMVPVFDGGDVTLSRSFFVN
jgi:hypothetical protein